MKIALIVVLLLPFFCTAQDCNLKNTKDPYTREAKISTGLITLNAGQYSIEATKSQVDFLFLLEGRCFDEASTAAVFFESSRLKTNFRNSGPMNCKGLFHITFKNTNPTASGLINLGTRKISSIRFKDNTGKETGIILSEDQQQKLQSAIGCITSEAKKLL